MAEGDWGRRPVSGSMQVARGEDAEDVEGEEGDEPGEVFWGEQAEDESELEEDEDRRWRVGLMKAKWDVCAEDTEDDVGEEEGDEEEEGSGRRTAVAEAWSVCDGAMTFYNFLSLCESVIMI